MFVWQGWTTVEWLCWLSLHTYRGFTLSSTVITWHSSSTLPASSCLVPWLCALYCVMSFVVPAIDGFDSVSKSICTVRMLNRQQIEVLLIFRSSPPRWPNKPGKNVRPSVRMSVRTYVRPSVRTSTIKHNAATNQIVEFVRVDETFTTIWLSRSSEVRVKVMWDLKFQKWRFSKSISSAIFQPVKKIPTVSDTRPKYLKSIRPDFCISS